MTPLDTIVQRAAAPDRLQHNRWLAVGGLTAAAAISAITITTNDRGSGPPTLAAIQMPAIVDNSNDCGTTTSGGYPTPAGSSTSSRVRYRRTEDHRVVASHRRCRWVPDDYS